MLSFRLVNLLIPEDPTRMSISTPHGPWTLEQMPEYAEANSANTGASLLRPRMLPVAETYFLENPSGPDAGAQAAVQHVAGWAAHGHQFPADARPAGISADCLDGDAVSARYAALMLERGQRRA